MSVSAHNRPRRSKEPEKGDGSAVLLRLAAAMLLFALCFVAKTSFPDQTQQWRSQLTQLIGAQTDLHQAVSQLGEELERREAVVRAVGDWCVNVFAPEGLQVQRSSGAAGEPPTQETSTGPEQSGAPESSGVAAAHP